nr:RNA-directed DNA polymerase, eukaryota, reverse transcriptase zinc-binding domain protein [Tanacetum cinerariifolium]
ARHLLEQGSINELIDPWLGNYYSAQEVYCMMQAASLCIKGDPHLRPRIQKKERGVYENGSEALWVSKLFNRLVTVLDGIVDEIQSAFVMDRQILDGPFILNEIVHWCKNKKKQSMIFKVHFEKAYDSVRWDFIDDILRRFGFGEKWCKWIQSCLYSSRGSVLVNGTPTKEFQFHKGLK